MERCQTTRLALNPKKSRLWCLKGSCWAALSAKAGLKIDLDKVRVIVEMDPPHRHHWSKVLP